MSRKLITKHTVYNNKFDFHSYLWFRYHNLFFGGLIRRGRKLWAFKFLCDLRYSLKTADNIDPFWIFLACMVKITPSILLLPLRLGVTLYGVPAPINERKRYTFAVKWVIKTIRDNNKRLTVDSVKEALIDALYERGVSWEKKKAVNETSAANRYLLNLLRR